MNYDILRQIGYKETLFDVILKPEEYEEIKDFICDIPYIKVDGGYQIDPKYKNNCDKATHLDDLLTRFERKIHQPNQLMKMQFLMHENQ